MGEGRRGPRDPGGDSGGVDLEPLRGGQREQEQGHVGPQGEPGAPPAGDPPGRAPLEGDPPPPPPAAGRAPREGAPPDPSPGAAGQQAPRKLDEARADHEREAANAPRDDPDADVHPRR